MVDTESKQTIITSDVLFKSNDVNLYVHTIAEQLNVLTTGVIINDTPNLDDNAEICGYIMNDSEFISKPLDDGSTFSNGVCTCRPSSDCIMFSIQMLTQMYDLIVLFNIKYNTTQREFQNDDITLSINNISMSEFQFTLTFGGYLPRAWYVYGTKATDENYQPTFVSYVTKTLGDLTTKVNELMQKT